MRASLVQLILFNCFFNDLFYLIEIDNVQNFAFDHTLTAITNNIQNLIHLLESESSMGVKWFKNKKMIVNPGKFLASILDKKN